MTGHFTSYETRTNHELATLRRPKLDISGQLTVSFHLVHCAV